MEKRILYAILLLIAAAAAVAIYLQRDAILAATAGSSSSDGSGSSSSGSSSSGAGGCSYPVDSGASGACILQGFKDSGYYGALDPQQQAEASNDPSTWLLAHPYLYTVYPEYFAQA